MQANHRYVATTDLDAMKLPLTHTHSFEAQLTAVKERLEAAKVSAATRNGNINVAGGAAPNGFGSQLGSRIAKPLRGGGGEGPMVPTLAGLQQQQQQEGPKRSSWFFNQRT